MGTFNNNTKDSEWRTMKKLLLGILLIVSCGFASAQQMIPMNIADSVIETTRFDITIAGDIIICSVEYNYGGNRTCTDKEHKNKFVRMQDIVVPGKKLVGFRIEYQTIHIYPYLPTLEMYFKKS